MYMDIYLHGWIMISYLLVECLLVAKHFLDKQIYKNLKCNKNEKKNSKNENTKRLMFTHNISRFIIFILFIFEIYVWCKNIFERMKISTKGSSLDNRINEPRRG